MTPNEEFARLEQKLDVLTQTVEKIKKYIVILLVGTVCVALLPILLGALAIPFMMSTLGSLYGI